jgi:hypothetical protein
MLAGNEDFEFGVGKGLSRKAEHRCAERRSRKGFEFHVFLPLLKS